MAASRHTTDKPGVLLHKHVTVTINHALAIILRGVSYNITDVYHT